MKRILIITYYWPPSGGSGVMRWLKMTKHLVDLDWKPVIFTPSNPDASIVDKSLCAEVLPKIEEIKIPIWEPYYIYRKLAGITTGAEFKAGYVSEVASGNLFNKISVFIRGNFFIPDPRKFWIKPSIKFLSSYLDENKIDLIISTGPPHSTHLIAMGLKKKFKIPWIADFRDPWTHIDFYNKLKLTKWAHRKHFKLENNVITTADLVVTVSENWANQFEKDHNKKVHVVTNGFEPEDFPSENIALDKRFTLTHVGSFNQDRNPHQFWEALKELTLESEELKSLLLIRLVGQTDNEVVESIKKAGLTDNLERISFVEHKKCIQYMMKSQILLMPLNDTPNAMGIIPGKVFEYMAAKRPIFVIGPLEGDSAKLIRATNTGHVCHFKDKNGMKAKIYDYFLNFKDNQLVLQENNFKQFSRKILAKKFISLYEKIK